MTEANKCAECGAELPASAPRGLCPACLLKRGLETNTVGYTQEPGPASGWTPPTVKELAERFPELEITRLIGRGGMGAVYQARQKNLDRVVALKVLPPEIGRDPAFAERFAREAQAMARLNHPHIVTIHEFGQVKPSPSAPPGTRTSSSASLLYFLIMEYVDGVSLRGLLDSGHVSPKEALAIVPQICDALQYAHDRGIVHRDIKPENILLNKQGRVKIADFGLAKLMRIAGGPLGARASSPAAANETVADSVIGTPAYMAPEQKDCPSEVDHRADIYSLGVVFYQMLTGELPKGAFEPPSRKVQIDVRLDEIVLKALEKQPERRYQHASEVKTQVETIGEDSPTGERKHAINIDTTLQFGEGPRARQWSVKNSIPLGVRLSRTAVVGAIWAALSPCAVLYWMTPAGRSGDFQWASVWHFAAFAALMLLSLSAPFGTTILGWIAVSQIRHSAGRLYGLGLAMFDGLCFPLLALDAAICLPLVLAKLSGERVDSQFVMWAIAFPLFCVILDLLLIRLAWRAARRPLAGSQDGGAAPETLEYSSGKSADQQKGSHLRRLFWFVGTRNGQRAVNWHAVASSVVLIVVGVMVAAAVQALESKLSDERVDSGAGPAAVRMAEQRLRRIEQLRADDAASPFEVEEAQLQLELAKAAAADDPALAARAKLRAAELRLRRIEELRAHDAASPFEVEEAQLQLELAKAAAADDPALAARAKLRAAELRLRRIEELRAHEAASPFEVEEARLSYEAAESVVRRLETKLSGEGPAAASPAGARNARIVDDIDLPFVDDPQAVGRWTSVDIVAAPESFKPGVRSFQGDLYLKELTLLPGGKTAQVWIWTKGFLIHRGDRTTSKYEIKEIGGTRYMFMEWKSGDYGFLGRKPPYYVLQWAGAANPLSDREPGGSHDPKMVEGKSASVIVEDVALEMLVAIREKNDAKLQGMSVDRIKGWSASLPHFAMEMRERFRQMTGEEFAMYPEKPLVEGDLAAVKCTGPEQLKGVYLVLLFVKTDEGWMNALLRNSPKTTPLAEHLQWFRGQLERGAPGARTPATRGI